MLAYYTFYQFIVFYSKRWEDSLLITGGCPYCVTASVRMTVWICLSYAKCTIEYYVPRTPGWGNGGCGVTKLPSCDSSYKVTLVLGFDVFGDVVMYCWYSYWWQPPVWMGQRLYWAVSCRCTHQTQWYWGLLIYIEISSSNFEYPQCPLVWGYIGTYGCGT